MPSVLATASTATTAISLLQLYAAPEKESIQQQENHGAYDRHDPASDVILARKDAADPGPYECAGDAEQNRNDATAGIFPRHQQLCDSTDNKADNQNPKNRMSAEGHIRRVLSDRLILGK